MKVLKFGGTSVGSVEAIESVKRIVEGRQEPVIVVVSAFSGVTDQLYKLSRAASQGDEGYLIEYEQMYARHLTVIDRMVPAAHKAEVLPQVQDKFADLLNILKGLSLIRDLSPRILDTVVGYGEMRAPRRTAGMPLEVRNARFVDGNQDRRLNAGELCKVIFEVYNVSQDVVTDVQPMVVETTGNKRVGISNTIHVERILPGKGVRYTAVVKAAKRLKDGTLTFRVYAVRGNGEVVSNVSEFSIQASRK